MGSLVCFVKILIYMVTSYHVVFYNGEGKHDKENFKAFDIYQPALGRALTLLGRRPEIQR